MRKEETVAIKKVMRMKIERRRGRGGPKNMVGYD